MVFVQEIFCSNTTIYCGDKKVKKRMLNRFSGFRNEWLL